MKYETVNLWLGPQIAPTSRGLNENENELWWKHKGRSK